MEPRDDDLAPTRRRGLGALAWVWLPVLLIVAAILWFWLA